ncbi:hypothetical protein BS47DRAFT_1335306 [Hydnum rufescens UP504]|uniref:t-SNARE coiled-coil homology domain-containing protein n=1 Tax=Hydnum rufescens UP504 TaxID=1448309 RepID=A0A9P6BDW2_9AGAM|nr:hypothetical protein BS47DRAFT_1335306 [Hydnum rufescens UP504]
MARDRLAAMRAQQGANQYDNVPEPSYPSQTPARYANPPGGRVTNPFSHQDTGSTYELADRSSAANANGSGYGDDDMSAFYSEISSIQEEIKAFNANVQEISDLHSRSLNNMDDNVVKRNAAQREALVEDTSALSAVLKRRIKALERQPGSGRDGQIRKQQTGLVKSKFVEAIQNYQEVERQYRAKYKQRMERQFRIVKPDATPEEVKAVVEDDQGGQIFSQALLNSNRYGESRAAYREVQERHEDIKRIEKTLTELAQLFNDMSVLVEQQDESITVIEAHAETATKDLETGVKETDRAVVSARAARRKRWICFIILLIILAIIGIVVGIVVANNTKKH